jgi:hypothetical protein
MERMLVIPKGLEFGAGKHNFNSAYKICKLKQN